MHAELSYSQTGRTQKTRWVVLTPHSLPRRRTRWKHGMKTIVQQLGTRRAKNESSDHRTTQRPSCTAIPINPHPLASIIILRADEASVPERPWFTFFLLDFHVYAVCSGLLGAVLSLQNFVRSNFGVTRRTVLGHATTVHRSPDLEKCRYVYIYTEKRVLTWSPLKVGAVVLYHKVWTHMLNRMRFGCMRRYIQPMRL
jgi:hypothetical protein